jgi:serine protease AprX
MSNTHALPQRIRWGFTAAASTAMLAVLVVLATLMPANGLEHSGAAPTPAAAHTGGISPALTRIADKHPGKRVEAIVQFSKGVGPAKAQRVSRAYGARVTGDLHIINGLAVEMRAAAAVKLGSDERVRAVTLNHKVKQSSITGLLGGLLSSLLKTSYDQSVQAPDAWQRGATGAGIGVAVVDTGISSDLADFRTSRNGSSRVVTSVTTNPYAHTDEDKYGHGTHVAGIIAGNGTNRSTKDDLYGEYVGVAPDADLVNVKIADDDGGATVLDAIYGLQFIVDKKDDYNIRVANLSFESSATDSYKIDPLDAAAEAAWFNGIVVVAAAGNRGSATDAVKHAPGNDPYVITVGAADDKGTDTVSDDTEMSWSSRGKTQDGFVKPDVLAPGNRIVSTLAPGSAFASMCPTCIVGGEYIRAGGTSMAAPVVAGGVADLLQAHPSWSPNTVKAVLAATDRAIAGGDYEIALKAAILHSGSGVYANKGLTPNKLIDTSTGNIDYSRSSWSRSSWSRSSWSRSSWSCECSMKSGAIDPSRSSWSRSSWSTKFDPAGPAPVQTVVSPPPAERPASSVPAATPAKSGASKPSTKTKRRHAKRHKRAKARKR